MLLKKAPGIEMVLTIDERKHAAMFFSLLIAIDHRVNPRKRKSKIQKTTKREIRRKCGSLFLMLPFMLKLVYTFRYIRSLWAAMIDTIVLILTKDMFRITAPDLFTPSAHWVLSGAHCSIISKQNPTKKDLHNGVYKARLTLSYRINARFRRELMLKIELSLPKLMFGNNFDELRQKDFAAVIERLISVLHDMGVSVTPTALATAPVTTVHYAKNIVLTDGSTPYHYISKMREANVTLGLDVNKTDYRNDGRSYKWHCNAYEVTFYDKIKDLEIAHKSDKRSLEKDNALQLHSLQKLQQRDKLEILRMEVRLNKRTKIRQLFKSLGITSQVTFKGVFKLAAARKVLLHYIDKLDNNRLPLLDYKATSDKALFTALIFNNPDLGPKNIVQMYGLKKALETITPRELRTMLAPLKQRSWQRLLAEAQKVKLPRSYAPFDVIRRQVITFKPLRLKK